jgi:hypothetical protein
LGWPNFLSVGRKVIRSSGSNLLSLRSLSGSLAARAISLAPYPSNYLPDLVGLAHIGTMYQAAFAELGGPTMRQQPVAPGPGPSFKASQPRRWPGPWMSSQMSNLKAASAALFLFAWNGRSPRDVFHALGVSAAQVLEVTMTPVKCLAVVALLVGGTSLAMAQNGPATGGQPPAATPGPPPSGVIPHDAPAPQSAAPAPNLRAAAPAPGASSGTRIAHRTPRSHTRMYMQAQHMIPGCAVGQPATATCTCGTGASGGPLLCQTGQWCHYPFAKVCTP